MLDREFDAAIEKRDGGRMDAIIESLIKAGLWPDQIKTIRPLIHAYAAAAVTIEREACAILAEQWGTGAGMGIPAAEFERRYGSHSHLPAAIRARATTGAKTDA